MFPIPSHISLYYRSYIFRTEWNGPDFGKRNMSWNGTLFHGTDYERINFGTAWNGSSLQLVARDPSLRSSLQRDTTL